MFCFEPSFFLVRLNYLADKIFLTFKRISSLLSDIPFVRYTLSKVNNTQENRASCISGASIVYLFFKKKEKKTLLVYPYVK